MVPLTALALPVQVPWERRNSFEERERYVGTDPEKWKLVKWKAGWITASDQGYVKYENAFAAVLEIENFTKWNAIYEMECW